MNRLLAGLVTGMLLAASGCCNSRPRPLCQSQPVAPPSPRPVMPVYPAPAAAPPTFPQAPPPAPPPSSPIPTVPPAPPPTSGVATPQEPIARVENRWQPADPGVQLGAPEPYSTAKPRATPRLYPPDKTAEPPVGSSATALPVGIPQFASPMDNVAAGLRPSLDEGLDWLQARGYRTVVHIHLPGEDEAADRKQVEKRGLKYVSFEVSPQTLSKTIVAEFNRRVRDTSGQPVFFYDRDGSLAGGLWYLYFRTLEQFSDDVARIRASALGLREDRDGAHRDMWLAVQKYLAQ